MKLYKIIKAKSIIELEQNTNKTIENEEKSGNIVQIKGNITVEAYPDFSPTYYQTVIISNDPVIPTEPKKSKRGNSNQN
jgi:hypothetical protein